MTFFRTILTVVLLAVAGSAAVAQSVKSGEYGSLTLGKDAKGRLTGHFFEALGVEDEGKPRFTCGFLLQAEPSSDGEYSVMTWHPDSPAEPIFGKLIAVTGGVLLRLNEAHGGCGMVAPDISSEDGQRFELTSAGDWIAAGWVRSQQAFFHKEPKASARERAFIVKDDLVVIMARRGDWADVKYTNSAGRMTRGWIKLEDLYPDEPF